MRTGQAFITLRVKGIDQRVALAKDATLVGRDAACDVVIDSLTAAKRHCELSWKGGKVWVRDLGTANKTYVNGKAVEDLELNDGDSLTIGGVQVSFQFQPTGSSPSARPDPGTDEFAPTLRAGNFVQPKPFALPPSPEPEPEEEESEFAPTMMPKSMPKLNELIKAGAKSSDVDPYGVTIRSPQNRQQIPPQGNPIPPTVMPAQPPSRMPDGRPNLVPAPQDDVMPPTMPQRQIFGVGSDEPQPTFVQQPARRVPKADMNPVMRPSSPPQQNAPYRFGQPAPIQPQQPFAVTEQPKQGNTVLKLAIAGVGCMFIMLVATVFALFHFGIIPKFWQK